MDIKSTNSQIAPVTATATPNAASVTTTPSSGQLCNVKHTEASPVLAGSTLSAGLSTQAGDRALTTKDITSTSNTSGVQSVQTVIEPKQPAESTFFWPIPEFSNILEEAKKHLATHGQDGFCKAKRSFTTSQGYRFTLRLYPNGHGKAAGTHMSLFFHLQKGDNDDHLEWPFTRRVVFTLQDQSCSVLDKNNSISQGVIPQTGVESVRKPESDDTSGFGVYRFVSLETLKNKAYFDPDGGILLRVTVR